MTAQTDILVVDDEQVVADSLHKLLSLEGLSSECAPDGHAALEMLSRASYRLVMLDLMLPDVSGLELIEPASRGCPVLAISGYATPDKALEAISRGAFDFLAKPFTLEELFAAIDRALRFSNRTDRGTTPTDDRYRLGSHSWARVDGDGCARLGAAESFCGTLGRVEAVELPGEQERVHQGGVLARIITGQQWVHSVCSPLSGRVIERNAELEARASLIGEDPIAAGWLVRVIPANLAGELHWLTAAKSP